MTDHDRYPIWAFVFLVMIGVSAAAAEEQTAEPEASGGHVSRLTQLDTGSSEEAEADDFRDRFGWFKENVKNGRKMFADAQAQLPKLLTDLQQLDADLELAEKNVNALPGLLEPSSQTISSKARNNKNEDLASIVDGDLAYGKQWTAESAQAFGAARIDIAAAIKSIREWQSRKEAFEKQADAMGPDIDEGLKAVDAGAGNDLNAWMDKMVPWVNRLNEESSAYEQSAKDLSEKIPMWLERAEFARNEMVRAKELETEWRKKLTENEKAAEEVVR